MKEKKNITFVINSLSYGGAQKMVIEIAEDLDKKGYNVSIINLCERKVFDRFPTSKRIPIISSNIVYHDPVTTNYKLVKCTVDSAKKLKSDVLVSFLFLSNFCAVAAGKILNIPTVISERSDPFHELANIRFTEKIKLYLINDSTGAVFQTQGASKFYGKKLQARSTVIPNIITNPSNIYVQDYDDRPNTIVTHGRIDNKQKRFDVMLRGFKLFLENHPDYKLIIYGSGPDEAYVKSLVRELSLSNNVVLKGKTSSPMQDISKEGIYVITSDYEGISNSLLEAMAVGLPVVSTDHSPGGARLLINDNRNGLLCKVGDAQSFANAIVKYADDPELAKACGQEAKKVTEKYAPKVIVDAWENYILRIMGGNKR